jgi:hypothetical protein
MIERQNELIRNIDKQLNLNEQFITKRKTNTSNIPAVDDDTTDESIDDGDFTLKSNNESEKFDSKITTRQTLFNRALEKVSLKSDAALGITTPDNIKHLLSPTTVLSANESKIETDDKKLISDKIFDQAKEKIKNRIQNKKEKTHSSAPLANLDDDFIIEDYDQITSPSNLNSTMMTTTPSPVQQKSNEETKQFKSKNLKYVLDGPVKNETDDKKNKLEPVVVSSMNTKKSNLKTKFGLPDFNFILSSPSPSPLHSPRDLTKKNRIKSSNGILKGNRSQRKSPNMSTNDDNKLNISQQQEASNSFNAFNVNNSPRLTRNSRSVIKHQIEEKRLERQRQEKRFRMSIEINRKVSELDTRRLVLECEGVTLEKLICSLDDDSEEKEKLEQKLYSLIHQKNLLTRVEDELNIQ